MHASTLFVCLLHASAKRATQKLGFTFHDQQAHSAVVSSGSSSHDDKLQVLSKYP